MVHRILVVDDHPLFAEALIGVVRSAYPGADVLLATDWAQAQQALSGSGRFDLALLDLWLQDTFGLERLISLRLTHPRLPVVVVSAFDDPEIVERSIVCGAVGFITKSASRAAIIEALHGVANGDVAVPPGTRFRQPVELPPARQPAVAGDALDPARCDDAQVDAAAETQAALPREALDMTRFWMWNGRLLTSRQLSVLDKMCQGKLNKQIAYELDIGETTVKAHVGEILRKLGVPSRTRAVIEVTRLDFPDLMIDRLGLHRADLRVRALDTPRPNP